MSESTHFDSVAATFPDSRIDEVLCVIHRQGHGHHARLIRCGSKNFMSQLERASIPRSLMGTLSDHDGHSVLVIEAPHQTVPVSNLLLGLGALQVERFTGARPVSTLLNFDTSSLSSRPRRSSSRSQ